MKRGLNTKKIVRIISVMFLAGGICLWLWKYNKEKIVYVPNMTQEQKLQDFHQFYSTVTEAMPFLADVKEVYGIDFVARKDYYEAKILQTQSDAEFYAIMQAISRDLCSFHTDICYPLYSNVKEIACYYSRIIVNMKGMEEAQNLWFQSIGEEIKKNPIKDALYVVYFDGEYIVVSSELEGVEAGDRLVSVNGVPANDYLVQNLSLGKICYDGKLKSAYRTQVTFNGSVGEEVQAIWKKEDGQEYSIEMKHSPLGELVMGYGYLYEEPVEGVVQETLPIIYSYQDKQNGVEYVKISNFDNNQGYKLKKILWGLEYPTVIIDLRGNYGGKITYFKDNIYPYLYSENKSNVQYWKTNDSKYNDKMTNNITVRLNKFLETEESLVYKMRNSFVGKYFGESRNIYYLIDDGTASSADFAALTVKKNNLGTLVGENTRGEGGGQSFICDKLDNSGLVFIYYAAVSCDETGAGTYTPGTEPDVYISATYEDYLERAKYPNARYENLVQYDPLIKWIIEND